MGDPSECTNKQTTTERRGAKRRGAKRPATKERLLTGNTYGLTVRHNPKYKPGTKSAYTDPEKRDLYNRLIGWLESKGLEVTDLYYEQKGGLHFHAKATHAKKIYFKKWQKKPFSIVFKKVYNPAGWLQYCQKEQEALQHDRLFAKNAPYLFCDSSTDSDQE